VKPILTYATREQICQEEIAAAIAIAAPKKGAPVHDIIRSDLEAAIYAHAFRRGFAEALRAVKLHGMPSKDCI
jgi:hypothetical protein